MDALTHRRFRKIRKEMRADGEAADAPCWLCGMSIRWDLPYRDPDTNEINDEAWAPDHLFPRSTHPDLALDPANLRHSHALCNIVRSNQAPERKIKKPSRRWTA